jgi:hypothetical protein
MSTAIVGRIPVVGGLAYVERVRSLPASFAATLTPEKENRYLPKAIAVVVGGEKVGYVAPEIAGRYFEPLAAREGEAVTCPGRTASRSDHETSGVELLLDFSALPIAPQP